MVKRFISLFDLQDLQLVAGLTSLSYGLYLVYPPSSFISFGLILMAPTIFPYFKAGK